MDFSFVLVHDLLEDVGGIVSEGVVVSKDLGKMCLEFVFALVTSRRGHATRRCDICLRYSWSMFSGGGVSCSGLVNNPHTDFLMAGACTPMVSFAILRKGCLSSLTTLELPSSVLRLKLGDSIMGILSTGLR